MRASTPVESDWYEFEQVGPGISLVRERHVAAWLRCNMWLIHGRDHDLLVDAGMGLSPLKPFVQSISDKPLVVILTHSHLDHIGAADEFEQRLGHRSEADVYANPSRGNSVAIGKYVRAESFAALPFANFDYRSFSLRPAPLSGYLDEGDHIDLGNRSFHVLHLPGHSPGSIALYEAASATLFSGDTVYDDNLADNADPNDWSIYARSLERLRALDIDVVHAGHYASFGRARLKEIIDKSLGAFRS